MDMDSIFYSPTQSIGKKSFLVAITQLCRTHKKLMKHAINLTKQLILYFFHDIGDKNSCKHIYKRQNKHQHTPME